MSAIFSVFSLIFLFVAIINIRFDYNELDIFSLDFLIAGIICMFLSIYFSYKYKQLLRLRFLKMPQIVTSIKCVNKICNYKEERLFQEGDYIFKGIGKCPKCNGDLFINAIYTLDSKIKK
ncbi:MAG: hypothetical protein QXM35_01875 [Candidatus Methanomethylicia archaeon]